MNKNISSVIATQGYSPVYQAIDRSIHDLKAAGYTRAEIRETIEEMFGGDKGPVDNYINKHL